VILSYPLQRRLIESSSVLGMRVCSTTKKSALDLIEQWIPQKRSRYICFANVHMVMEAYDDPEYQELVNRADLVSPDGMPLVWLMHKQGFTTQERVTGPDLMLEVLERANRLGWKIGMLGGTNETLQILRDRISIDYPSLDLAYTFSPPFQDSLNDLSKLICEDIRNAGVQVLLVGLGCPKQERWMAEHGKELTCVMLGVGAAFQFHTGQVRQAPAWVQKSGMEWLFRCMMEPKRLWKRYAKHNPRFLWLIFWEFVARGSKTSEGAVSARQK
jgi:N-acetylglucosaminyldiphosphoundecaprenol N-acetyl-beta-D-mannosaminyltransferase